MTTATQNWYPSADQRAASDDPFLGWSTQTLLGIAERVTPAVELDNWVATVAGVSWRWDTTEQMWERLERNHTTGRMDVTARYLDEDLRDFVLEQLERYGTTRADVGYMKS